MSEIRNSKESNPSTETPSRTKTVESGAFIRTTYRVGKKRKQETKRFQKNQKKVILGRIGDFEIYCYPYEYPDTVFIGQFPVSTQIDSASVTQLISGYNKAKSYLDGNYFKKPNWRKGANSRRRDIKKAYNLGLDDQRSKK